MKLEAKQKIWIAGSAGLIAGFVICGLAIFTIMPSLMIITHETTMGLDETVSGLQESIKENGWQVSQLVDMNKSLAKHGREFEPEVKLVKLCHPDYAKEVLGSDRYVSCLMPCTIAVWQGDDGKTYLSKMNLSLMAKMFGGTIADVMGGKVVEDEKRILEGFIKTE